jgi:hypothetical protein
VRLRDTDAHPHPDAYSNSDPNTHADTDTDANPDSDANPDTYACDSRQRGNQPGLWRRRQRRRNP